MKKGNGKHCKGTAVVCRYVRTWFFYQHYKIRGFGILANVTAFNRVQLMVTVLPWTIS